MLRAGSLTIDSAAHRVELDGVLVPLTRAEFALLHVLAAHPGQVLEHRDILRAMWGSQWLSDTTPLQVHVSRLRRKLGESASAPRHIITVHGIGYRFDPSPQITQLTSSSVTLMFDHDHRLLDIAPRIPVCGWQPDEIIGRRFSPLVEDPSIGEALIRGLLEVGAHEIEGRVEVRWRDGRRTSVHAATRLQVDARGRFLGMQLTLDLPADADPGHGARTTPPSSGGGILPERPGNATGPVVADRA